ncbi:MAG TPA: stage IV sporulation protein A [Firmicutes bacterium]|nr:stage IV sporulation protein A [Candidatus Fermentithermobacillaceae bacterium]
MEKFDIFMDIARRTNGDIYIGVVGPMRVGKSTFIRQFMELFVLPNLTGEYDRERTIDSMPQAGSGRTVTTVEPKFIPEDAVPVDISDSLSLNVKMVDCTGYPVEGAVGYMDGDEPRMVRTPWFEEPVPFVQAAELGTEKVIADHSTIGIVVTSDGSIVDLPRESYVEAERKVVEKLTELGKPFVIVLNCRDPYSKEVSDLATEMEGEYGVPVIPANCLDLNHDDITLIMEQVLYEFPLKDMTVRIPKWVQMLSTSHWLRSKIDGDIRNAVSKVKRVRDIDACVMMLQASDNIAKVTVDKVDMATGTATLDLEVRDDAFLKVMSERAGTTVNDKADLLNLVGELAVAKKTYDKLHLALQELEETGYGIVEPTLDDMTFEEPEMVKQGRNYGVRLRARGPAIHMIRTEIETTVSPVIGTEEQGEELVSYLAEKFEDDPRKIWSTDLFGKPLRDLVLDGVTTKIARMPEHARHKMQETLGRVVNEGSGGLICIIL